MEGRGTKPLYWIGDVCIHDGWCWWSYFVEIEPTKDGRMRWKEQIKTMGKEETIVPILKGLTEAPEELCQWVKDVIEQIRTGEEKGDNDGVPAKSTQRSVHGARTARGSRNQSKHIRHTTKRKRSTIRQGNDKE